jgi:hypothetical protein
MDKAIVALVMGALSIVNLVWGIDWFNSLTEEVVGVIIACLMPIFVFFTPNKT